MLATITILRSSGSDLLDSAVIYVVFPVVAAVIVAGVTIGTRALVRATRDFKEVKVALIGTPKSEYSDGTPGALDTLIEHGEARAVEG